MARRFDTDPIQQCAICGKQVADNIEMEEHMIAAHPDSVTAELRDQYNERRGGRAA